MKTTILLAISLLYSSVLSNAQSTIGQLSDYDICVRCCEAFEEANVDRNSFQQQTCIDDGCQPENRPKGCDYSGQGRFRKQRSCTMGRSFLFEIDGPAEWVYDDYSTEEFFCTVSSKTGTYVISNTRSPTYAPTSKPTLSPTKFPTPEPTPFPTPAPTNAPTKFPTPAPTDKPTAAPTKYPTPHPTPPTNYPTEAPTRSPTPPTNSPTERPTSVEEFLAGKKNKQAGAAGSAIIGVVAVGSLCAILVLAIVIRRRRRTHARGVRSARTVHSKYLTDDDHNDGFGYGHGQPPNNSFRPIIGMGGRIAKGARALSMRFKNGFQRNPANAASSEIDVPNPFDRNASYTNQSFSSHPYNASIPIPLLPAPSAPAQNLPPPPGLSPPLPPRRGSIQPPPTGFYPTRKNTFGDGFEDVEF
uniref:Uncharacterized protein n=1 Tax=Aplanochytrium stocchinoi TaxID=215587 RepID=A0A6S8FU92_9STRA|mmetsp:Transcript_786/g.1031  ORF Transcript_786/g.1031 Transcript_786/m.1031 type:complete len:414 (-) Transcript_786:858-2099(-)